MNPQQLELLKNVLQKSVEEAIKKYAEGSVPFAWVAIVVTALVGVIGILWAWGLKQSQDWVKKLEALKNEQLQSVDSKEDKIRERYNNVINQLKEEQKTKDSNYEKRIERLEKSRDLARDQYEKYRKENEIWLKSQYVEASEVIRESNEIHETVTVQLEKANFKEGD